MTGGAGYIGSHIMKMLLEKSRGRGVSLDKKITPNQKNIKKGIFLKGSVGDSALTERIFKKYKINIVMHLAGLIRVEESMQNPDPYFRNNVAEGIRLLESMRRCGVKKMIFASSAAIYGLPREKFLKEDHLLHPVNVYGLTKLMFENTLRFYNKVYGMDSISFRFFNVAGADSSGMLKEYHSPETHLVPCALKNIVAKKPVCVFGKDYKTPDGTCIRDFIHVNDISSAFLLAVPRILGNNVCESFNLGSGKGYSVLDVVSACGRQMKISPKISWCPKRAGDPGILVARSKAANRILKWKPKYNLDEMVSTAVKSLL